MVKGAIFDLDGTLVHSLPDLHDSMNAMLRFYGYPEIDEAAVRRNIGCGAAEFVLRSLPSHARDRAAECRKKYGEIYAAGGSPKTALFPGIADVLRALKAEGVRLAIVSNKPHKNTLQVYEKYLSDFDFDFVYGQQPGGSTKPDPEGTLACLAALGLRPEEAAFVGDGETDAETAIRAGTHGVSVLWGYRSEAELRAAGARLFARDAAELYDILFRID